METFSTLRSGSGSRSASAQRKASPLASPRSSARSWATRSMAGLTSDSTTRPARPRIARKATSPVPPGRSSSVSRGDAPMAATKARFQARCAPSDIRSFIRS